MNHNIKRLLESAPYTTISTEGRLYTQQDVARFAEALVKECVDIANNVHMCRDGKVIAEDIKQHFGLNRYTQEDLDEAHKSGVELAKKLRVE